MEQTGRRRVADRIIGVIAVLTIVAGAAQMIVPGMALEGLGLEPDRSAIFAFRLASFLILCFGALLLHEVRTRSIGKGTLWAGIQKLGAALLLVMALLSGDVAPLAWGVVAWDGLCGLVLSVRTSRPPADAE